MYLLPKLENEGTLAHQFSFDNFSFPKVPGQNYTEAYQENPALVMKDINQTEVVVYKNRWQLLVPNFGENKAAAFAPRQGTQAILAFTFAQEVKTIKFDAGMFADSKITHARVEAKNAEGEWIEIFNFYDFIGIEAYAEIEVGNILSKEVRIVVDAPADINDNAQRVYIDNLKVYL